MAINWNEIEEKAHKKDKSNNGGIKLKRKVQQVPQNTQKNTETKQIPNSTQGTRAKDRNNSTKSNNKHKLDSGAKAIQQNAIKTNAVPQALVRFNERVLNDGILAPVSIPYQIATGKKLLDFGFEAESDSAKKGAAVGNFIGTAAAYGTGYGAAGKAIGKGANKLLATEAGKKATAKIVGSKLGQKAGKETAEKVAEGVARNLVGDATVGTLMNLSAARGEGLEGKELAKDMAINAAMDFGLGNAFEFVPMAFKAAKNAAKNTSFETRIVDGKQKNVRVRNSIPEKKSISENKTYNVSRSGSLNQRLGAKTLNEAIEESSAASKFGKLPYAQDAAYTLSSEAQQKVFKAVENRSGAKIMYADLPEGIDGTYQNGVITISSKAQNPSYTVLKHELTHHIESSGNYKELSDFIQGSMREAGYDVDQSISEIISDYAKIGKNLTTEEAEKEFTAKFAEEYLFNSEKSIERLARENPNIFRQIYDWIVDTIHKIGASEETKFLIDAQRKYEKALRTVGDTSEKESLKYSLNAFADGKRFVNVDTDTSAFDGLTPREQGRLATRIIKEKYAGKVVGVDNPIFVNGRGAGEFGFPVNKLGAAEHAAKMQSATELDNMFDAGHNFRNAPDGADGHIHNDVTGGFDYHDVIFKVGERYYKGTINVKNTNSGKLFKDITKIEDVTEDISSSYGLNPKSTFLRASSMDSIPEPSAKSKKKIGKPLSAGSSLKKDELLATLKETSQSLYGETGNKYLQEIPKSSVISAKAHRESQPIPHASEVQNMPDTISKARRVASEAPDITSDERWDYMLENAPGERHARKLTDEEWSDVKARADDKFRADSGMSKREMEIFYREPRTEVKETKKAQQYEKRKIREADTVIKEALGVNKYSDAPYIKKRMNEAVEKMRNGSLSTRDREQLFDEIFANGIKVDTEFAVRYQDLKKTLRETPIKVSEGIRKNITDFADFRRRNTNRIRLNDKEGVQADIFYDELKNEYPELFPELNTPEEMVERIAEVASDIKITERRVSEDVFSDEIYEEAKKRFEEVMDELEKEESIIKRYTEKHVTDLSSDEMQEVISGMGRMKRQAEKVKTKVILNEADREFKDMMLKGKLTPEQLRMFNLNANNIIEVYNAEKPYYDMKKALKNLGDETKNGYRETAKKILEGSEDWYDKKSGFRYARETAERNMVDVAGKEAGEKINKEIFTPIHEHEALATKMKNDLRDTIRNLNISTTKKFDISNLDIDAAGLDKNEKATEARLLQLYGENLITREQLKSIGADVDKLSKAVTTMRGIYDQLIEKANNELIRHGYEPIEFRQGYFPHFTEERPDGMLAKIGSFLGINVQKDELPTDIAGLTHTFRPGKKWFGNALQRTSKVTEYDAIKGFDIYIEGISDIIYHTEDIQKLRALESELRFKYSDEGVKQRVKEMKEDYKKTDAEKEVLISNIYEEGTTKFGGLATWLRNYTDQLAGKKSQLDRVFEQGIGRTMYNSTKAIEGRIAANMVALNPASWLTNFIPLVQAGEISPKYVIQGMAETVSNAFRKTDDIADISSFITNRKGSDVLWKSNTEKVSDFLTKPMEMIDGFTSQALVRAKYAEQIAKGVPIEKAIATADRFAADIIAERSKGALPTMFNSKNPIAKIFTMYQVEVNNQWSHLLKDIPRSKDNVAKVALAFTNFAVGAYIFNDVYEKIVGRRPALDPISWVNDFVGDTTGKKVPNFVDAIKAAMEGEEIGLEESDKKTGGAALVAAGENIAQDIPFVGGLLEGGRVPISSALPSVSTLATNAGNLMSGDANAKKAWSSIGKELAKPATYIVPPVGGGQIKKIVESSMALSKGGTYGLNKDGEEQLKFAVDRDAGSIAKGLLFGQYAIGNSQEYVDSGFKQLSAKKTQAYKALTEAGMKNTEAEEFIRSLPTKKSEMRESIMNSNLTAEQKNAVGGILDEKTIDYSSKNSYSYSQMSESEQEIVKKLKKSGMSQAKAEKVYDAQKGYQSDTLKANALFEEGYRKEVMKQLGLSDKSIAKGKALNDAGLTNDAYTYTRKNADKDGNGSIKKDELIAYLKTTSYTRKQKFALYKAIMGCKDQNNPYR